MAKREDIANGGEGAPAQPTGSEAKNQPNSELPLFDAPPLSPGGETPADDVPAPEIEVIAMPEPPRFRMAPRHRRYALLAASVALAAGLGGVIGVAASGGFARQAPTDVAGQHERKAMQQTIARLGKEITALKTSIAAANKPGHSQVTKTGDKIIDKPIDKPVVVAKPAEQPVSGEPGDHRLGTDAALGATGGCNRKRAAGASRAGEGLVDPRRARRLSLCARPRRHLPGRARRALARPRPGAIDQAPGRPLGGDDAQGHYCRGARPAVFRIAHKIDFRSAKAAPDKGAAFLFMREVICA